MNDVELVEQKIRDIEDKLKDMVVDKDEYLARYKIQRDELKRKLKLAKDELNTAIIKECEKNGDTPLYCYTTHPKWKELDKTIDNIRDKIRGDRLPVGLYVMSGYKKQHIYAKIIIHDFLPDEIIQEVKDTVNNLGGWTLDNDTGRYYVHRDWIKTELTYTLNKPVIIVKKVK